MAWSQLTISIHQELPQVSNIIHVHAGASFWTVRKNDWVRVLCSSHSRQIKYLRCNKTRCNLNSRKCIGLTKRASSVDMRNANANEARVKQSVALSLTDDIIWQ